MKIWLGDYAYDGGDAIKLLDYLAERETFYPVEIHTANPVGRENMYRILDRYWPDLYKSAFGIYNGKSSRWWHYNSCVLYFW